MGTSSNNNIGADALCGAVSGFGARLFTAPLDVIKIRFQLQSANDKAYRSILDAVVKITRQEGIASFWKGNLSATYLWVSYSAIQFALYGSLKNTHIIGMNSAGSPLNTFVAGAGSGASNNLVCLMIYC
jgi:solute carrier family 25 thiamine pyrophosphate transporter 19